MPTELERVAFRLTLVVLAAIALATAGAIAWERQRERAAAQAMTRSFDDYNHFVEACGNERTGVLWDLAVKARATLEQATAERAVHADRRAAWTWLGPGAMAVLALAFYAVRWALTGRLRPLWPLAPRPAKDAV